MTLVTRADFRDLRHIAVTVNSLRLRLELIAQPPSLPAPASRPDKTPRAPNAAFIDLVIGHDLRTWDFVQLLADTPALSDCDLRVDSTFSTALTRELPDAVALMDARLGCLQDMVSRTSRAGELRRRCALPTEEDGNPVVLCVTARSKIEGHAPCVLAAMGTDLHVFRMYPTDPERYDAGGRFAGARAVDITEVEKLQCVMPPVYLSCWL